MNGEHLRAAGRLIVLACALALCLIPPISYAQPAGQDGQPTSETAAAPAKAAPIMRKGPYLSYNNKHTNMTLFWQTSRTPRKTTVEWGPSPSYGHPPVPVIERGMGVDGHQFDYTIGGLSPDQRYYWRVTADGEQFTGSFLSAPDPSATSLTFYGYGGSRNGADTHNRLMQRLMEDKLADPDHRQTIILHSGDYVSYGLTEYFWDVELFGPKVPYVNNCLRDFPLLGALGESEGLSASFGEEYLLEQHIGQYFRKYLPFATYKLSNRYYYSFSYGPLHVAVVDTWSYPGAPGDQLPDARQMDWLKQDLKASKKPWKVVMIHTPVWDCAFQSKVLQNALTPIIESTESDVRLVIQGHGNYYSHVLRDNGAYGITYLTLGGGGAPLSDPAPCNADSARFVVRAEKTYHLARFEIAGNTLTVTVLRPDGTVVETFQVLKEKKPLPGGSAPSGRQEPKAPAHR